MSRNKEAEEGRHSVALLCHRCEVEAIIQVIQVHHSGSVDSSCSCWAAASSEATNCSSSPCHDAHLTVLSVGVGAAASSEDRRRSVT